MGSSINTYGDYSANDSIAILHEPERLDEDEGEDWGRLASWVVGRRRYSPMGERYENASSGVACMALCAHDGSGLEWSERRFTGVV